MKCAICGKEIVGSVHSTEPLIKDLKCCSKCFKTRIEPLRKTIYQEKHKIWEKENSKRYSFRVNIKTDKEIYEKLESVKSIANYIKALIKADLEK